MDLNNDTTEKRGSNYHGPIKSVEGWILFVTNLHVEIREDDVRDAFEEHGHVKVIKMNFDRRTGYGKGYALVEYEKQSEAQDAINKLHHTELMGKSIGVHWAFAKPSGHGEVPESSLRRGRV